MSTQILNARGIVVDQTNHDERPKVHGFVRAETTEPQPTQPATVFNPEEIEVVDEDDEEEEAQVEETKDIPEPQVPDTVFGSLVATAPETAPLGAKDRFKKKKN